VNPLLLTRSVFRVLREGGVPAVCARALGGWAPGRVPDAFDRRHGTDTGGLAPLWRLSIGSRNARFGERYQATQEGELVAALGFLGEDLRRFGFVDLGCGKGRTLLVAAALGFRQVTGVEFARELVQIAARNIERAGAVQARVLHADAAEFEFPPGDTVLYLYNPFSAEVLRQVLDRLRARAARRYVVYKTPRCAALLDACDFLEPLGSPADVPQMRVWRSRDPQAEPPREAAQ
jgi:SAM-dependent methyltransferase